MAIITVKTQQELDMIPLDTEDIIRIEFGTFWTPAIVCNRYKYRVVARENSSVVARENSSVVARGNSSIEARGNSSVVAWGNSSVVARENSSVVARENSSIEARGNSSVVAWGNVQVVDFLQGATIQLFENARTVYMPRNIEEFMNFYGIEHDKTTAIFYKAVHKRTNLIEDEPFYMGKNASTMLMVKDQHYTYEYVSDYDADFKYEIGKMASSIVFNDNTEETCGGGIHISHKSWALDFGKNWKDLALLEVKVRIKDILLPKYSDGKVRAPKVEVVREVPLEECGLFGKILLQRRKNEED